MEPMPTDANDTRRDNANATVAQGQIDKREGFLVRSSLDIKG